MSNDIFSQEVKNIIKSDKYLRSFSLATGVNASIYRYGKNKDLTDNPDNLDVLNKISNDTCCQSECQSSEFCSIVHTSQEGRRRCSEFREKASLQCISLGESYITRCHAGLTICFAPLVAGDRCIGAITCGPVIMWEFDEFAIKEAKQLAKELDIDADKLVKAGKNLVRKTSEEVGALADILLSIAESLAHNESSFLNKNRDINFQQARIAELLHKKKQAESRIRILEDSEKSSHYPHFKVKP